MPFPFCCFFVVFLRFKFSLFSSFSVATFTRIGSRIPRRPPHSEYTTGVFHPGFGAEAPRTPPRSVYLALRCSRPARPLLGSGYVRRRGGACRLVTVAGLRRLAFHAAGVLGARYPSERREGWERLRAVVAFWSGGSVGRGSTLAGAGRALFSLNLPRPVRPAGFGRQPAPPAAAVGRHEYPRALLFVGAPPLT